MGLTWPCWKTSGAARNKIYVLLLKGPALQDCNECVLIISLGGSANPKFDCTVLPVM